VEFIYPEDVENVINDFKQTVGHGKEVVTTFRVETPKMGIRYFEDNGRALRDDEGQAIGVSGLLRDVTERQQAEEALHESEAHYRLLADNVTDVIWTTDLDLRFTYVSPSVFRLLGYTVEEYMGLKVEEVIPPTSLEIIAQILADELNAERSSDQIDLARSRRVEFESMRKDGSIVQTEATVIFLRDADGRPVGTLGVSRDITERKRAEEALQKAHDELESRVEQRTAELAKANEQLRQEIAERRRAEEELRQLYEQERKLGHELQTEITRRIDFTRALVHELKTPLTAVMASGDLLATELTEGHLVRIVRNLNRTALNLNNRIDELLDLAKGELGILRIRPGPVDLLQLLHDVVEDMTPVASSQGQSIILDLPSTLAPVRADGDRLRQVVMNLLNNAFKFTPEGGATTVRARQQDSALLVEIQNPGEEITEEEEERLFEPYYRAEQDRQRLSGLGLGLALCKTIVELHGGLIWVESKYGEGNTFGFSVPLPGNVAGKTSVATKEER